MELQPFDKDEIIPKDYDSYESYIDDINDFLYKYHVLFTNNIYNSSLELISLTKSVHSLITKEYEKLPQEFLTYFNSIKSYLNQHPDESKIIYESLLDLSTDEFPLIPSENAAKKNLLKEKFMMPKELEDFISISRKLTPKEYSEENKNDKIGIDNWFQENKKEKKEISNQNVSISLMTQKKKYEVQLLGNFIINEAKNKNINTIIDIGCGKGYLTNYISMNSNLRTIGIEGDENFTNKMMLRINKIEQIINKENTIINKAEGYTSFLTYKTTPEEFKTICKINNNEDIILTGLHPCGDLTPTLMRLFKNIDQIKALIFIGCCYNKLSENPNYFYLAKNNNDNQILSESFEYGFPISKYLLTKNKIKFHLSNTYISSNPNPNTKTREEWFYSFKMCSYRLALELFIHKNLPNFLEVHYIGQIRENHSKSFGLYLNKALNNIKNHAEKFDFNDKKYKEELIKWINNFIKENDVIKVGNEFYKSFNTHDEIIFEVVPHIILGARISQILEGLIVADRVLFLKEFCTYVSARRLFHPFISPRGIQIIAYK